MNSQVKTLSGMKPVVFWVMKLPTKSARHCICTPKPQKNGGIGAVLEDRSAKCAPDCRESSILKKKENMHMLGVVRHRIDSAARRLLDLVQYSSSAFLQPAATKLIGTAARSRALVMLRRSCCSGLQLGVSKGSVTAVRKVVSEHHPFLCSAELQLNVAVAKCTLNSCMKRRIGLPTEEVTVRQPRAGSEKK